MSIKHDELIGENHFYIKFPVTNQQCYDSRKNGCKKDKNFSREVQMFW